MHTARFLIIGTVTTLAVGLGAAPAAAAPGDPIATAVTFTITGGDLDLAGPSSKALGSAAPGSPITTTLGAVTVTDSRGAVNGAWTVSVTSSDFITGGGDDPGETIAAATHVKYWTGSATTTGNGTFSAGQANGAASIFIATPQTAISHTGGTGNSTATWDPTLIVNTQLANVAGGYTGTVTHSVA